LHCYRYAWAGFIGSSTFVMGGNALKTPCMIAPSYSGDWGGWLSVVPPPQEPVDGGASTSPRPSLGVRELRSRRI